MFNSLEKEKAKQEVKVSFRFSHLVVQLCSLKEEFRSFYGLPDQIVFTFSFSFLCES